MRAIMDLEYHTVAEANSLNYFSDEILSLYEAAKEGIDGPSLRPLEKALDALDAKAKEKL